jgi:phage terminase large subunit
MTSVVIPYSPRALQREIHQQRKRWSLIVCHRRFGKTVLAVNELIRGALTNSLQRPRYAYIAPYYKQAKSIAWDYLKHYSRPIPGVRTNEAELRVDYPNGGRVQLFGADNPDALRGQYFDGVVLDEYAQMPASLFSEVIRPALSDRQGWAMFIGTPKGKNEFYRLYEQAKDDPAWMVRIYRASETGIIPDDELADARKLMDEDEYAQEYECSWTAAIQGSYYGKLLSQALADGRIGRVPYEPRLPVYTVWDLGIGDATAIWFAQLHGREIRLIDYYEQSGEGLPHYAKVLQERGYVYGEHFAPHDIQVRELGSGKSRIEIAQSLGIRFRVAPNVSIEDGIEAVRSTLPLCWFDEQRCRQGLDALQHYRREWDDKRGEFKPRPLHDWSSHGSDAFRYLALGLKEKTEPKAPRKPQYRPQSGGWMR